MRWEQMMHWAWGFVATLIACSSAAAVADSGAHASGTGAVATDACGAVLNVHATDLGHEGQYLDLVMGCGTPAAHEIRVERAPDCIAQFGATAYLAYVPEQVRIVVTDGGMAADQVGVVVGPFRKAKSGNSCRGKAIPTYPAVGDFMVGL